MLEHYGINCHSAFCFGGNIMFNPLVVENELSKRAERKIRFSYETYIGDDFNIYRKVIVDNRDTNIKVFFDALQDAQARGILEQKYDELLTQVRQYLLIKR